MPVTDLAAKDFIVREGDLEREVLRVSKATDPFQMALLVDNSSALNPYLNDVRTGLREFVREMGGQHEIALVGFGARPTILVDYTRDVKKLTDGIDRLFPETLSGGYMLDAFIEVGRGLKKREGGRRAFVVVGTTLGQEFSERYHRYVLEEIRDSGATLHAYMIGRPNSLTDDNARERSLTIDQGAAMTGGRQEDLLTSSSLPGKMRELAAEIKNQYAVVYSRPQSLIPPDSIEVGVRRPELVVRAQRVLPK
jgi:VWFA-related protein